MLRVFSIFMAIGFVLQAQAPGPSFEAASIRPQPWTNEGRVGAFVRGNTLYGEHADLYTLVAFAWNLDPETFQVSGGPGWARRGVLSNVSGGDSTLYQVIAKAPEGAMPSTEDFRLMLRTLLADRFQLRIHTATKDLPVFHLVPAKDGTKMTPSKSDAVRSLRMADGKIFRMRAVHVGIGELVEQLSNPAHGTGRPVIDKTGLGGFYDFEIEWIPGDLASVDGDSKASTVFTAVQERLGLKLEPGTAPFPVVVIDSAERPEGN